MIFIWAKKVKKTKKDSEPAEKQSSVKLNLTEVLTAFDKRDYEYYDRLSDDLKKQFSAFVLMRFMSSGANTSGMHEYYLQMINFYVNNNFWALSKHPELQFKLLCLCGTGTKHYHKWLPANNKKLPSWYKLYKEKYNDLNDLEFKILTKSISQQEVVEYAKSIGKNDQEIKEFTKDFKKS